MFTVRDAPLENIRDKRIFVLVDPNIERAAPALGSLRGKGARLVVATHLPDPPGATERRSLEFAQELSRVLGLRVLKLDSAVGPEVTRAVFEMRADEVVLLENLSIFKEDAANDVAFARQLGMLCEVFVNDAFDTADRPLASNTSITRWVPIAVAGPSFHERVQYLKQFLGNPTRPFMAIVGGGRIAHKLELLHAILPNLDRLFVGGSLAFSFLKVRGHETGKAAIEAGFRTFIDEFVERARKRVQLVLPEDFLIRDGNAVRCVPSIHSDDKPVDIGVHSLAQLTNLMAGAYSILWIDSLGVGADRPSSSDWEVMQQIYASIPRRWQLRLNRCRG